MAIKQTKPKKKKKYKVSPTAKQRKVIEILAENGGKSKGEVLKEAGYSVEVQESPSKVFESVAIKDFFAKDGKGIEALKQKHNDLLNSADIRRMSMPKQLSDDEIITFFHNEFPGSKVLRILLEDGKDTYKPEKIVILRVPDGKLQQQALDMAYKVLGLYKDPNAGQPPISPPSSSETTLRISRAEKLFQLGTPQS